MPICISVPHFLHFHALLALLLLQLEIYLRHASDIGISKIQSIKGRMFLQVYLDRLRRALDEFVGGILKGEGLNGVMLTLEVTGFDQEIQ